MKLRDSLLLFYTKFAYFNSNFWCVCWWCWSGTTDTHHYTLSSQSLLWSFTLSAPPTLLLPPSSAHTCSLGTKWMQQSHLIGLHFRIQGHLECLFDKIAFHIQNCSWQCLRTMYFVVNGCLVASGHQTFSVLILKIFCPQWLLLRYCGVFFFHTSHFGHFRRIGRVLATSSVPDFFFLACLFLSLSCGWSKDNWVAVFDCNHSKSLSLESSTVGNTVPPLQEPSAHFHYILRCSWRIQQSRLMSNAQAHAFKPYNFYW